MTSRIIFTTLMAAMLCSATRGSCQTTGLDTVSSKALLVARERGDAGPLVALLRQRDPKTTKRSLDAVADSLVQWAIRPGFISAKGSDVAEKDFLVRQSAISSLASSASAGAPGQSYAGAGDRLVEIAIAAPDPAIRALATGALLQLDDKRVVVQHLVRIAESKSTAADQAVRTLAKELGSVGGLKALRDSYMKKSVTEPTAVRSITAIARANGWV